MNPRERLKELRLAISKLTAFEGVTFPFGTYYPSDCGCDPPRKWLCPSHGAMVNSYETEIDGIEETLAYVEEQLDKMNVRKAGTVSDDLLWGYSLAIGEIRRRLK